MKLQDDSEVKLTPWFLMEICDGGVADSHWDYIFELQSQVQPAEASFSCVHLQSVAQVVYDGFMEGGRAGRQRLNLMEFHLLSE